jgi:hypothetical protein
VQAALTPHDAATATTHPLYLAPGPDPKKALETCNPISPTNFFVYNRLKRKRAAEEKNVKLKSPNFALSPLRLSVRNIPSGYDERRLRALFVDAVKQRATKENPVVKQVRAWFDQTRRRPEAPHQGGRDHAEVAPSSFERGRRTPSRAALRWPPCTRSAFASASLQGRMLPFRPKTRITHHLKTLA